MSRDHNNSHGQRDKRERENEKEQGKERGGKEWTRGRKDRWKYDVMRK